MNLRRAVVALAWCAAAVAAGVPARADETVTLLSRQRAVALAVERGPAVREARLPADATGSVREASRAWLPYGPRVSVAAGRRTGDFGAGLEIAASAVQDLSLHGLGGARRELAAAIERSARTDLERARLEAAGAAVLAWIDLLDAQELAVVRRTAREDADEIARVARARVDRGVASPSEGTLAQAEQGVAELGERDAEGRLFEAKASLRFAVGLPPSTDVGALGELHAIGPPASGGAPREHVATIAARTKVELSRAEAALGRAQAAAPIGVGVSYAREGTGEQVLSATIVLPVPLFDPSRFEEARHATVVAAAQAQNDRVRAEIERDLVVADHERVHTREVHDTLRDRVLVPLREAVRVARAGYQAGTQDVTAFLMLRQRLVVKEEELAHAAAAVHRADLSFAVSRGTLLREVSR